MDDPVVVDPDHYAVEFENDQVRVLRIKYGQRSLNPTGASRLPPRYWPNS